MKGDYMNKNDPNPRDYKTGLIASAALQHGRREVAQNRATMARSPLVKDCSAVNTNITTTTCASVHPRVVLRIVIVLVITVIGLQGIGFLFFQQQNSLTALQCKSGHDVLERSLKSLKEDLGALKNLWVGQKMSTPLPMMIKMNDTIQEQGDRTGFTNSSELGVNGTMEGLEAEVRTGPSRTNSRNVKRGTLTSNPIDIDIGQARKTPQHDTIESTRKAPEDPNPRPMISESHRSLSNDPKEGPVPPLKTRFRRFVSQTTYMEGHTDPDLSVRLQAASEGAREGGSQESSYLASRVSRVTHPWLALTAFSKIPYKAVEQFCSQTHDSCPPGPPGLLGPEGPPGPKGDRGDIGDRGLPGTIGARGPPGLPGPMSAGRGHGRKGAYGRPGNPGLDGRDGLPGEPGLDGIPGRNGLDGIPGVDGLPGLDGLPGKDGKDGRDGGKGLRGERGNRGPIGPTGMTGPPGRMGTDGEPGSPGSPGISTWLVNNTAVKELLIPPSIPGYTKASDPLLVREGDHVRLRCTAAGHPTPKVEWRRDDGGPIPTGRWKDGSVDGPILNLTHVRRDHTGAFRCEAFNGIPPNAYRTYRLEVHFEPFLKVKEWKVGSHNGSSARLECQVEAYPPAETHWENKYGRTLTTTENVIVRYEPDRHIVWRGRMTLIVVSMRDVDFGDYHCIARNSLAVTRGLVSIYEIDSRLYISSTGSTSGISYGPDPPNYSKLFNDLCPPPTVCPTCPSRPPKGGGTGLQYCLNIEQFGQRRYSGFRNRSEDCQVSAVGKPVFHRHTNATFGSWMQEAQTQHPREQPKFYTTDPDKPFSLLEFTDKDTFRKNKPVKNHTLPYPFTGSSHLVYNRTFFYHQRDSANLVRYELFSGVASKLILPQLVSDTNNFLYRGGRDYVDLGVDENGLWVIYGLPQNGNNTVVTKIDPNTLKIEYSWNISLSHHKFGEMFITCGVLYGIDSTTVKDTKIRLAFDLYTQTLREVDLPFTNPFQSTTMLSYNPHTKEIYSWDSGNQLSYPIKHTTLTHEPLTALRDRGRTLEQRELG